MSASATRLVLQDSGSLNAVVWVNGTGLTYDSRGLLNGGTITSIELVDPFSFPPTVLQRTTIPGGTSAATLYTNILSKARALDDQIATWNLADSVDATFGPTEISVSLTDGTRIVLTGTDMNTALNAGTVTSLRHLAANGAVLHQATGFPLPMGVVNTALDPSSYVHLVLVSGANTVQNFDLFVSSPMTGGAGNDTFQGAASGINDFVEFVSHATSGVVVNLVAGTATGGAGTDTLVGIEHVQGSYFNDTITGNAAENLLMGFNGDDVLDGGAGADRLDGGLGDDRFIVDSFADTINELAGEGTDTVVSSIIEIDLSRVNFGGVENATLLGTTALDLFGNALDNVLVGNAAVNRLEGAGGNDTLDGGAGADILVGGLGNDVLVIDTASDQAQELPNQGTDTLSSANLSLDLNLAQYDNIENIKLLGTLNLNATGDALDNRLEGNSGINTLLGGNGADTLVGDAGGDIMDGGAGIDTYIGGLGDDAYYVRNLGANGRVEDIFTELANQGTDGITTTVTLNLNEARYVNIENVYMSGTAAITVGGSAVANVILGNDAANGLYGLGGRDIMRGGGGVDTFFYLNASESGATATTRDLIQDFTAGTDKINLAAVDANGAGAGNGTFVFLATQGAAFTNVAGQLRFRFEDNANNALDKTIVEGDTNGDGTADFAIEMSAFGANSGLKALTASDFIL